MSANTLTIEAANAAGLVTVGPEKGSQAVHDLVTAYRANRRTGSANTKTRGEVAGNNRKIYRQKGTGNARHGDHQSPIFVGGGVVFGPRPCDYSKKVNKSTRKLALRRVLGDIITGGKVVTVPSFSIEDGKTKSFVAAVSEIAEGKKILIIADNFDEMTKRAGRNVAEVLLMSAAEVNVEQLLDARKVVIVESAMEIIANRTK
ncbi:MAG: 50S ribosomal protein L4 [Akkermansia sp.]|nr:50S ribosomal protein L4 [Akkermansia sp.]MBQ2869616.1 50S ribosomal protein L4 [Akkermansia sp.]MBQ8376936.1 50S ribosomal protein L4 [Akkermansia sp.]MBQ8901291.1 50S ribosomal protein L4 [Akkermansia sp.]MBQ9830102.1 50S ribosomal protein L4 [Akkermansia sp.]